MTQPGRWTLACIAALLLAGHTEAVQAQRKGRAPEKPAPADNKSLLIDTALQSSSVRTQLALVRSRMKQLLEQDTRLDYDARRWIVQTIDAAFSPEAYARPIKQALLDDYDADALTRVLVWNRSAAGRKIVRLEQATTEPGVAQARGLYLATLENKQPSEDRLVLIFRIDEASHASEATYAADKAMINGWNRGIAQVLSGPERHEVAQTQIAMEVFRAQLRDIVSDGVLREMMYAYREATNAELRAYAEFLESDAGKWFFNTVYKGQQAVVEKAVERVADEFVTTIVTRRTTRPPSPAVQRTDAPPAAPNLPPAPAPPPARK
jgi:hypothetical protein